MGVAWGSHGVQESAAGTGDVRLRWRALLQTSGGGVHCARLPYLGAGRTFDCHLWAHRRLAENGSDGRLALGECLGRGRAPTARARAQVGRQ
eukprot:5574630-Prymnesium_polylepis.1